MEPRLKYAMAYTVQNGLRGPWAIFPLCRNSKVPLHDGGFKEASSDPNKAAVWWSDSPFSNIGIATGAVNGFIVIDVDVHTEGVNGNETLTDLEERLGKLPDTVEAITATGGRHLFFRCDDARVKNTEGKEKFPGIDIRGNGGYVVGVGSVINGKSYEWEASSYPNEVEMAALPPAWLKWAIEEAPAKSSQKFAAPEAVTEGGRNSTLFKFGCSLRGQNVPPEEIRAQLIAYNLQHCQPPLADAEVQDIITHTLKYQPNDEKAQQEQGKEQKEKAPQKDRVHIENLCGYMAQHNLVTRYNLIKKEYETVGYTEGGRAMTQDDLITTLHNDLADSYRGCNMETLTMYTCYIARENSYNPVLDYLGGLVWDNTDRLPQLYDIIGLPADDELSKILVKKWLLQTVALLYNSPDAPFGADGCLVLNGLQGAGKTSLFRHLALRDEWFGEGACIDDRDKDTTRRILGVWVAELGEVESTLKSDISKLKAFVTNAVDHYRLPYGRSDVVAPRMTSLCATCNSDRYLIDPTGNRRWWSVPFTHAVNREQLTALDAPQLWAQIFAEVAPMTYKQKSACYRLTDEEKAALALRNGEYEKPLKGQPEVEDILAQAEERHLAFEKQTLSQFKQEWPALKPYTVQQISAALKRLGIDSERTNSGRWYTLPIDSVAHSFNEPCKVQNLFGKR